MNALISAILLPSKPCDKRAHPMRSNSRDFCTQQAAQAAQAQRTKALAPRTLHSKKGVAEGGASAIDFTRCAQDNTCNDILRADTEKHTFGLDPRVLRGFRLKTTLT